MRNEPTPTIYCQENAVHFAHDTSPFISAVLLAMQDALLGKISHQLRWITVADCIETKELSFYFFYDGEISEKNYELSQAAVKETLDCFPGFTANIDIRRLDYPEKIPSIEGGVPYARCEDSFRNIQW